MCLYLESPWKKVQKEYKQPYIKSLVVEIVIFV